MSRSEESDDVLRATTSGGTYTTVATAVQATNYNDTPSTGGPYFYYVAKAANFSGVERSVE
jgi:cellulose 1,4-beta-cellobiosidase